MKKYPFLEEVGLEVIYAKDGESELEVNLAEKHTTSWGSMHGGVTMTLLDVCMSRAARSSDPEESGAATIEMKVSFFQPGGQIGQRVTGKGRLLHNSGRMFFCEGEVWNGEKLVAKALGTFKVFHSVKTKTA
ncbi:PaaI family thioesterase [uncultured Desulfobacter sp.]|uniref:PaaI family thioesterase n=1 Tax=uncultured Desulfobacter sp. TaxID=240139 RepID=UPI0029F4FAC7|nr:PaaI family thioesterase [uncultured Desulfobacter sp.]